MKRSTPSTEINGQEYAKRQSYYHSPSTLPVNGLPPLKDAFTTPPVNKTIPLVDGDETTSSVSTKSSNSDILMHPSYAQRRESASELLAAGSVSSNSQASSNYNSVRNTNGNSSSAAASISFTAANYGNGNRPSIDTQNSQIKDNNIKPEFNTNDSHDLDDANKKGNSNAQTRQRIRVARACDRCKQRKTKCDGLNPCAPCRKQSKNCTYSVTKSDASTSSSAKSKSGPLSKPSPGKDQLQTFKFKHSSIRSSPSIMENENRIANDLSSSSYSPQTSDPTLTANVPAKSVQDGQFEMLKQFTDSITSISNAFVDKISQMSTGTAANVQQQPQHPLFGYRPGTGGPLDPNPSQQSSRDQLLSQKDFDHFVNSAVSVVNDPQLPSLYKSRKNRYNRRYITALPNKLGGELYKSLTPQNKSKFSTIPRMQNYGWNMSGVHYVKPRPLHHSQVFINEPLGRYLVDYFFTYINPVYAVLHKPMFMKQYESFLLTPQKKEMRLFMSILHIVCAISMRFSEIMENKQYEAGVEENLFDDAYGVLEAFTFEWESVEICQGWLLLTIYLRTCHRQPAAWSALGQAIRLASGLGVNHRTSFDCVFSEYDKLKRERLFWSCFVLDRTLCIDTGRHFSFFVDQITIPIPEEYVDDGWQTPLSFGLVKLCILLKYIEFDPEFSLSAETVKVAANAFLEWNESMKQFNLDIDDVSKNNDYPMCTLAHFRLVYYSFLGFLYMRSIYHFVNPEFESSSPNIEHLKLIILGTDTITNSLSAHGKLLSPWWTTMSALYNTGLLSLVMINRNLDLAMYSDIVMKVIAKFNVMVDDGRFIMAKECLWSLKTLNHLIYVRASQVQTVLSKIGLDHGEAKVNKSSFLSTRPAKKKLINREMEEQADKGYSDDNDEDEDDDEDEEINNLNNQPQPPNQTDLLGSVVSPDFQNLVTALPQDDAFMEGIGIPTGSSVDTDVSIIDPAMSLDWFANWT